MSIERTKPIAVKGPDTAPLEFWARQFIDLQLKTIVSVLAMELPKLFGKVLDIGAGESPWKYLLNEKVNYQGIDIQSADEFGMHKSTDIVYYDGLTIPFSSNEFDSALCIEVLEHTEDPQLLLNEAFRILKPAGVFILTVPWSARVHHIPFDFQRFTPFKLKNIFTTAGFIKIEIKERGNNLSVIANKITILIWGLLLPPQRISMIWSIPLGIMMIPMLLFFLIIAHVSLFFEIGDKDDPLGYAVKGIKP